MKRRIVIREYQNCINIEVRAKKKPFKRAVFIGMVFLWLPVFLAAEKYGLLLPWALILSGLIYYTLWLYLEKITVSVFPQYIMVVRNYFFLDITGKFFQRDAIAAMKKSRDNTGIVFEYLGKPQTLLLGLTPEETSFVMKFLVFSLGSGQFKKQKPNT